MEANKEIVIDSLSEAQLYASDNVIIQTGNDVVIGKGKVIVTSRNVIVNADNGNGNGIGIGIRFNISLRYQDITFHAINKTDGYILLNINDISGMEGCNRIINRKLFIYSNEAQRIFDQISIGSSMNSDEEQLNGNCLMNALDTVQYSNDNECDNHNHNDAYIEEEEDEVDQGKDRDMQHSNYKAYDYTNSIDQIFSSHKVIKDKTHIPENDSRRFEDAD